MKKYWGFILHFGYVESSYVSNIMIHHMEDGFDTLEEALKDLATVFFEDYIDRVKIPTIEGFLQYLYQQPTCVASGGVGDMTFLPNEWNSERWWPWDSLSVIYPYLDKFWEIREFADTTLLYFLDLNSMPDERLKTELIEFQKHYDKEKLLKEFECVVQ